MTSLIRIYAVVLSVLIIAYVILYRHWKNITKNLIKQTDTLLYYYDKAIFFHKNNIHNYQENKTILFHNQQQFFDKEKNYHTLTIPLLKDIDYLTWLLQEEIVDPSIIKIVKATYITWEKMNTLKEYTYIILIILTLWIGKIFLP